ncbi:hypothetical protein KUL49_22890 [Alteromonas sp. KUL49]|nr:hypothetical protein KUL49_22890 [Alteromonas sp. KUL49]
MTQRIAIVGTGISGLTSAYLLNRKHDITVYEANDYIGGHTATKKLMMTENLTISIQVLLCSMTGPTPTS